jgi:hypothetical protein
MSRLVYEGNTKIRLLVTIASGTLNPTAAECAAGKDLSPFVTKDGIAVPNSQNMVDSATINDVYDAQRVGSWGGGPLVLTMYRDDTLETNGWDAITYSLDGFLVISRRTGLFTASSKVEVWPVEAHQPVMGNTAANEMQKFTAAFAVTAPPNLNAVVS